MSESDPRAPGAPWLTPYLTVRDAQASLQFYERAFGFEVGEISPDDNGNAEHCEMYYRDTLIAMFAPEAALGNTAKSPRTLGIEPPQTFYVYCDDPDAIFGRAMAAGAHAVVPPTDQPWGDRMCCVRDIDGYQWGFARWHGQAAPAARAAAS